MGQVHGSLRSHAVVQGSGGEFVLETAHPPEHLEFDSKQSYMISFGIDLQTNERFRHRSLSSIAGTDAQEMTSLFKKIVGLPAENCCSFVASRNNSNCTYEGIKESFIRYANKVDTNGIFIFHFSGHGLSVGKTQEWGLAPTDFDYTRDTFITGSMLAQWLQQAVFQGRYALFILDTCYSGGIGKDVVVKSAQLEIPAAGIFVMTACTANETSVVVSALGRSIFCYFLSTALFESYSQPGKLYLKELYETCDCCCLAFSSLLLSYDPRHETLGWKMMEPELMQYNLPHFLKHLFEQEEEGTDGAPVGRFAFLLCLYDYSTQLPKNPIPQKCLAWLDMVSNPNCGALQELGRRNLLEGKILTAVIAVMTYSVVSLYQASNDTSTKLSSPNIFIVMFLQVVASVNKIREFEISHRDVIIALEYYLEALGKQKISSKALLKLRQRLLLEEQKVIGEEFTDSGEIQGNPQPQANDDAVEMVPLPFWVPLECDEDTDFK